MELGGHGGGRTFKAQKPSGPPEALKTWLGQTLLALPFSSLYRAKILVLVIKGLNRSKDLVRTSPHYINRSQNMVRTNPRVLISSGGPEYYAMTLKYKVSIFIYGLVTEIC